VTATCHSVVTVSSLVSRSTCPKSFGAKRNPNSSLAQGLSTSRSLEWQPNDESRSNALDAVSLLLPPCSSIRSLAPASPSPLPANLTDTFRARRYLSNTCGRSAVGMPTPWSCTDSTAQPRSRTTCTTMSPPLGLYLMASRRCCQLPARVALGPNRQWVQAGLRRIEESDAPWPAGGS
jgi:hypothetical protein